MKGFTRCLLFCLLLSSLMLGRSAAETESDRITPPVNPPGIAELIPRLAEIKQQSSDLNVRLEVLRETDSFTEPLQRARQRAEILARETASLTDPTGWNFDRSLDTRSQLVEHQNNLDALLNGISARLQELDSLRQTWQEREAFWRQWRESIPKDLLKTQQAAFKEAAEESKQTQQWIVAASSPLVSLQGEVTQLQEKSLAQLALVDNMLQTMQGKTFQKTARSFTSPRFYNQFDRSLLIATKKGLEGVSGIGSGFFRTQGWLVGLQLLIATLLTGFLIHKGRRERGETEWQFILLHPLATAIFVATIACGSLYSAPPALWRWMLAFLAAFSSAVLISGLLDDPRKKLMIYVLAGIYVLTLGLQIIALPLPLYRLYLALLSLLGIPFLLVLAARHRRVPGRRNDYFILALRLGALVLFCSFVAQWIGYSTLSSRLFESSMKTVFLGLFSWMTLHLGRGSVQYLIKLPILQRRRFIVQFGDELEIHLRKLLLGVILGYVVFYLMEVWGVFPSAGQAWRAFLASGFMLGQKKISMHLVLLAVLTLYASIQGSWILGALLETEFFPTRSVDLGVRDSILKLLHYGVITVGFLLAISLLGFELKNFVVLAGALGIGIGFGLQHIVNNFVSGLLLLFERPVKVGDMVMIESEWCTVRKIGLRATIVETFDQSEIIVPNSDLISQKVTNWTLSSEQSRVVVKVGVAYGTNVKKVLEILTECAAQHPKVLADPPPSPLFVEFGDSAMNFELRAWVEKASHRLQVKSDLLIAIDEKFHQQGVEIPFPQHDLHLRSIDTHALENLSLQNPDKDRPGS
jgi:small-conductance mechanosensitive channel